MIVDFVGVVSWTIVIYFFCKLARSIWLKEKEVRWRTAAKKHYRGAMRRLSEDNVAELKLE